MLKGIEIKMHLSIFSYCIFNEGVEFIVNKIVVPIHIIYLTKAIFEFPLWTKEMTRNPIFRKPFFWQYLQKY